METLCGYGTHSISVLSLDTFLVYCTCLMASFAQDLMRKDDPPEVLQPIFCVGVNDLQKVSMRSGFVGCTSFLFMQYK